MAAALALAASMPSGAKEPSTPVASPQGSSTEAPPLTAAPVTGPQASLGSATESPLTGAIVLIDPGHNGANSRHLAQIGRLVNAGGFEKPCNSTGTTSGTGVSESATNLSLARELGRQLTAVGAQVVYTRTDDVGWGPCVDERGRAAGRAGAAVAVSLHADGTENGEGRGFHVIVPAERPGYTDDIADDSLRLGTTVRSALTAGGFTPSTYVAGDGLVVRGDLGTLNWSDVPIVMLEAGNLRNAEDAQLLESPDGQRRLAASLATALEAFLR
jgi:N-acetylmuramoyl-L-alanine amidase